MKRCKYGKLKRKIGRRVCKSKPAAKKSRKPAKRKKSPLTKYFVRGNRAKGTKRRYLTQRELDSIRARRAREAQGRRDAKRALRPRSPRVPRSRKGWVQVGVEGAGRNGDETYRMKWVRGPMVGEGVKGHKNYWGRREPRNEWEAEQIYNRWSEQGIGPFA